MSGNKYIPFIINCDVSNILSIDSNLVFNTYLKDKGMRFIGIFLAFIAFLLFRSNLVDVIKLLS